MTIIATLGFFAANRLLPAHVPLADWNRSEMEVWAFYLVWLGTLGHAALRGRAAWREQVWAVAGLALLAVALNWATTGHHLALTLGHELMTVAGVDLLLLALAALAAGTARHLGRKATRPQHAATAQGDLGAGNSTSHA